MSGQIDSYTLPPAVRRIAGAFRIIGWISFWAQIVLAVVSGFVLLFAVSSLSVRTGANNAGTGFGLFFAICGLVALFLGAYWAFRYTRLSRRLKSVDSSTRPKPKDAMQAIRMGLIINLAGMLLSLLGAEAIIGVLLAKSLSQPQVGIYNPGNIRDFIQSLDIFIVQANTHIIAAHFAAIVSSLLLLRSVNR